MSRRKPKQKVKRKVKRKQRAGNFGTSVPILGISSAAQWLTDKLKKKSAPAYYQKYAKCFSSPRYKGRQVLEYTNKWGNRVCKLI